MKNVTLTVPESRAEQAAIDAQAARDAEESARRAQTERNRKRLPNIDAPKPGTTLIVAKSGSVRAPTRGRAGLQFESAPREVKVVSDEEYAEKRALGIDVVTVQGAEDIIEDANGEHLGLVIYASKSDAVGADLEQRSVEELEAALAKAKARAAKPRDAAERLGSTRKVTTDADASRNSGATTDANNPTGDKAKK
jgi:hypothetical protein